VCAFLADGVDFPPHSSPAEDQIDQTCNKCIDCLKSRVPHCFVGIKDLVSEWGLSTWANGLSRCAIEKKQ